MAQLAPGLRELRNRGGKVDFFIGVDLKGTSIQGLDLANSLATTLKVVHDPEGRTFHPKVYLATGRKRSYALIGSTNLTAGGMAYNYEAAVAVDFSTKDTPAFVKDLELFVDRLNRDTAISKRFTPALRKRLISESWLADEARDRRHRREDRLKRGKSSATGSKPLFGRSRFEKRFRPPPGPGGSGAGKSRSKSRASGGATNRSAMAHARDAWWKQLGPGDAQRPPHGHQTRVVRLTAPHGIDGRETFFRKVFFGDELWSKRLDTRKNQLEIATIEVAASIGAKDLGTRTVEIDYGEHRDVRGRATTVLHWGDLLPEVLSQNLTGHYLLLERGQSSYRLSVSTEEPA